MIPLRIRLGIAITALALFSCSSGVFVPREAPPPPRAPRTPGQVVASSSHFENGLRMYEKGKYRQAAHMFEQALRHDRANYRAAYYLGMCDLRRGRYVEARRNFRLGLELAPDNALAARIHGGLGYSYEMQRQHAHALEHYRTAVRLDPEYDYGKEGRSRTSPQGKSGGKKNDKKGD